MRPLADSESQDTGSWEGIWALKVPNKLKNHLWRACRNSLPTKTNLVCRTIIANDICDRCHGAVETVVHALWECPKIDVVWNDAALWDFRFTSKFVDFKNLVAWIISHQKNSEMFAMLAWAIWNQHNNVRRQEPSCSLHLLAQTSKDLLQEFKSMQPIPPPLVAVPHARWKPPSADFVKINVDEVVFTDEDKSGIGVVIRNHEGQVLASQCLKLHQAYSPGVVDALVVHSGITLASDIYSRSCGGR